MQKSTRHPEFRGHDYLDMQDRISYTLPHKYFQLSNPIFGIIWAGNAEIINF